MGVAAIRAQIATIMRSDAEIEIVHEYDRFSKDWPKFLALFADAAGKIHGYSITRRATPSRRDNVPTIQRAHQFLIRGYMGLNDAEATELAFQDEIEAIQTAFDSNNTLNGTVLDADPLQVKIVENRVFGNVLCHYAELTIEARERVRYT
jgi:hypothetical protein